MKISVNVAVEGYTDEIVVRSILKYVGLSCDLVRGLRGKHQLLKDLSKYNGAARYTNWLVVVDLDHDADCAPKYVKLILPNRSQGMILRIAVRAIEAWLMADRERIAQYLGISVANIPLNPDAGENPKTALIDITRRKSRKTTLQEDMIPRPNSSAQVGAGYVYRINEFVNHPDHCWRPDIAATHSESLHRCLRALQRIKHQ